MSGSGWASRPPEQPFDGKPIGLMGAAAGVMGHGHAHTIGPNLHHLRRCFVFLNILLINRPEVMIAAAQNKFRRVGQSHRPGDARLHGRTPDGAFKAWVPRLR